MQCLFRVESPLATGKALADNLGFLSIKMDIISPPLRQQPAELIRQTFCCNNIQAAVSQFLRASSALLPSRRTTTGTLTPTSLPRR